MDPEPPLLLSLFSAFSFIISVWGILSCAIGLIILLCASALVSGSEVAFFSLSPNDLDSLEKEGDSLDQIVLKLRNKPRKLLATILISNNFINIAIVLVSNSILRVLIGEQQLLAIGGWMQSAGAQKPALRLQSGRQ